MTDSRATYNIKDCIATRQIYDVLAPQLTAPTDRVYRALMGLQGATFGVQLRGIRIDLKKRKEVVEQLKADVEVKTKEIETLVGRPLEKFVNSPKQLAEFFYSELGLRAQRNKDGNPTTDADALERIGKRTVAVEAEVPMPEKTARKDKAAAVAALILECRDLGKQASSLAEATLENGRMRTTLVPGGTESFRLSAHKACTNKGHNQQNVDKRLKACFVPDDGFVMVQMDQSTAESMVVAFDSQDEAYIDAHLNGNTHVNVGRLLWPKLPWPADPKEAKEFAKTHTWDGKPIHGRNAYYDSAKATQHALNFLQTPHGMAQHIGLPVRECEQRYATYFAAFPGIPRWHDRIIDEVRRTGLVTCPGGFRHLMLGRRWDRETWRSAVSRIPQSIVAWTNHIAFTRLYYELEDENFQVLGHIHDAVLFQIRESMVELYMPRVEQLRRTVWNAHGREFSIPWETKTGYSWKEVS